MPFNEITTRTGLIQQLEDRTTTQSTTTSSFPLATKTREINQALANFLVLAQMYSGNWKVDDTNNASDPSYSQNLVIGQRAYTFTTDSASNEILTIDRVEAIDAQGNSYRLKQLNRSLITEEGMSEFMKSNGQPEWYDINGKNITLYPASNYAVNNGLKLYTERSGNYFLSTDTTKVAGIPRIFHEYLVIRPAYYFTATKGLPQAKFLQIELMNMEKKIESFYSSRNKDTTASDVSGRLRVNNIVYR